MPEGLLRTWKSCDANKNQRKSEQCVGLPQYWKWDIHTSECGYLAGYGECCKHVSALLHYIEHEWEKTMGKTAGKKD